MAFKWNPSPDFLAQAGHMALGALFVFTPMALYRGAIQPAITGTVFAAYYALLKEAVWDVLFEDNNPFIWVGIIDLAFILGGSAAAWVTWGIFNAF